jgi:hypothetical protein
MKLPKPPKPAQKPKGYSGNIDLFNRPRFRQPDGSISTVRSMSVNINGKEILLPTIGIKNGRPAQLTDEEAIQQYNATGKHLGKFTTPEEATKMAEIIHNQQAFYYGK